MLAEIRGRSQITIPAEIVKSLGIVEGDKFEVIEKDGGIFLCPVVVYPKEKMKKLGQIVEAVNRGEDLHGPFDSVAEMFADMGIDIENV